MSARTVHRALGALAFGLAACAAPALAGELKSWSSIRKDITGAVVADIAFHSPNPWLVMGGATYKLADLSLDIGNAAIDRQDRWYGAEMILADKDARRLKKIQATGGDLNGPEANEIKQQLRDRQYTITLPQRSPYGYTAAVIVGNLPYAVAKVGIDKAIEKAFGFALDKIGLFSLVERYLPFPKAVNWAMNYGGPLEDLQKEIGWGKLGWRARAAEKAAEDAMRSEQEKAAAAFFSNNRTEELEQDAADALAGIYGDIMSSHPSQPAPVVAPIFRLDVARAVIMAPTPAAEAMIAAIPAMAATPAPTIQAVAETREADPVAGAISVDDAQGWRRYSGPTSSEPSAAVSPTPSPPAEEPAWVARMHAESALVGDGKTFAVCSNGCPSSPNSSWTGGSGNTLYNR